MKLPLEMRLTLASNHRSSSVPSKTKTCCRESVQTRCSAGCVRVAGERACEKERERGGGGGGGREREREEEREGEGDRKSEGKREGEREIEIAGVFRTGASAILRT